MTRYKVLLAEIAARDKEIARLRLTDAERKAVKFAVRTADDYHDDKVAAILRGLLARLGGAT